MYYVRRWGGENGGWGRWLAHLQHLTVVVDYSAVEPVGVGGLLRETHHTRGGGLYLPVFHVLDVAVNILCQQQLVQIRPFVHHGAGKLAAEGGELLGGGVGAQLVHAGDEVVLTFPLHVAHIHNHGVVAQVAEVAHAVEEPEGRCGRVAAHGAVALAEAEGNAVDGAEHGAVAGAVGVVNAEPDDAAQVVGEPAAALRHKAEAGLLGADGTLVDVLFAIHLEVHGAPAVGAVERTCAHILGHVHGCTLEVVAHQLHHVVGGEFLVGLNPQREAFGLGVAHGVGFVTLHALGYAVEEGIDACLAGAEAGEGEGVVGVGIAEVGVLAAEPAVLAGMRQRAGSCGNWVMRAWLAWALT